MENKVQNKSKEQNMILENREKMNVSGVNDVVSFTNDVIIAETELGMITIKGHELKISKLNIDNSELIIEGYINSFFYSEITQKGAKGFFNKIFR